MSEMPPYKGVSLTFSQFLEEGQHLIIQRFILKKKKKKKERGREGDDFYRILTVTSTAVNM